MVSVVILDCPFLGLGYSSNFPLLFTIFTVDSVGHGKSCNFILFFCFRYYYVSSFGLGKFSFSAVIYHLSMWVDLGHWRKIFFLWANLVFLRYISLHNFYSYNWSFPLSLFEDIYFCLTLIPLLLLFKFLRGELAALIISVRILNTMHFVFQFLSLKVAEFFLSWNCFGKSFKTINYAFLCWIWFLIHSHLHNLDFFLMRFLFMLVFCIFESEQEEAFMQGCAYTCLPEPRCGLWWS